jgi:hypothetical protein
VLRRGRAAKTTVQRDAIRLGEHGGGINSWAAFST